MVREMYLFIGAHVDDIEIGATGFLIKSLTKEIECSVLVFSDCENQPGNKGISKEFKKSMKILGVNNYFLLDLPNTKFPASSDKIREVLENFKKEKKPKLVVTHSTSSIHQDHLAVARECQRVFRYISVISYEDFKSTPYFVPNLYVPLSEEIMRKKKEAANAYKTQLKRLYYSPENLETLAKKRGIEAGISFAEAYEIIRLIDLNYG